MDLTKSLMNHKPRTITVSVKKLFPKYDLCQVRKQYGSLVTPNDHTTLANICVKLANHGYEQLLQEQGFWQAGNETYQGHCHQSTPALAYVLTSVGFNVDYIECYRIKDEPFINHGTAEKVPPTEEQSDLRDEFININRIPYCTASIRMTEGTFLVSAKHITNNNNQPQALLTPTCYQQYRGNHQHHEDATKSALYLAQYHTTDGRLVWKKQTHKDPTPEHFIEFLRMHIKL